MLSRREKLLQQPWEERRYKDHRSKVKSALPAIDDRSPPPRPHVALKLKKLQKEMDRKTKIQNDNFSLLQRLSAIMKVNRLDNHWAKPLPRLAEDDTFIPESVIFSQPEKGFQSGYSLPGSCYRYSDFDVTSFQNKVGQFYDVESLNSRLATRCYDPSQASNQGSAKCFACDYKKMNQPWRYSTGNLYLPSI